MSVPIVPVNLTDPDVTRVLNSRPRWDASELAPYDETNFRQWNESLTDMFIIRGCKWLLQTSKVGDDELQEVGCVMLRKSVDESHWYILDTDTLAQGYATMTASHNKWLIANKPKLIQRLHECFRQAPTEAGTEYISRCQTILREYHKAECVYDISTELVSDLVAGMLPTYLPLKQQHCSVLAYTDVGSSVAAMVGIEETNAVSDQLSVGLANHDKPKQQVNNKAGGRHHDGRGSGYKGNKNVPRPRKEPSGHCPVCGAKGHWAKECPRKAKPTSEYIPPNTDTYT
jgi:hypothetical protein